MNKITKCVISMLMALFLCESMETVVYASDGQEYITISVEAEDNSGNLLYALDTDDPGAFSSSNEFSVPAGTSHTIYVKDSAGNITSQEYTPTAADYDKSYLYDKDEGRTVNIDITLDDVPDTSDYKYAGDLLRDPAEEGQGTLYEKVETPTNDPDAKRLFYTVTTEEGEVFYLVVDQNQSSNNVYLLDQVKLSDLHALAINDSGEAESQSSSLLSALKNNEEDLLPDGDSKESDTPSKKQGNPMASNLVIVLIIAAIGGGFYYYKNVYKNKKDEQMDLIDAPDKDDFAVEEDDDEGEVDFELDEDYQEQILSELLEEDDFDSDNQSEEESIEDMEEVPANSYAMSHSLDETNEDEEEFDDELDSPDEEDDE